MQVGPARQTLRLAIIQLNAKSQVSMSISNRRLVSEEIEEDRLFVDVIESVLPVWLYGRSPES